MRSQKRVSEEWENGAAHSRARKEKGK